MMIFCKSFLPKLMILSFLISLSLSNFAFSNELSEPSQSHKIIESISENKIKFSEIPINFLNNKKFIMELISKNICPLEMNNIPEKYYDDFDVMAIASNQPMALIKASNRLKDDKQLIKIYVSKNGDNIQYASDKLKRDPEIIELSLKNRPSSIKYIPIDLITRQMVIMVIKSDLSWLSQTYKTLPEEFKSDKEIIKIAFAREYIPIDYMPESIQNDENFIIELVKINPILLNHDFKQKNSSYFKQKIKEMLTKKEIVLDFEGPNKTNSFLNLLHFSENAYDDGKALHLKLKNGTYTKIKYIFEKYGDASLFEYPYFWGYRKDLGFYLVNIKTMEEDSVLLIDDVTGKKLAQASSYPIISPDKKYLISFQSDAFDLNGIEIFEIYPHEIKSVYKKHLLDFEFDSWKENNSFLIKSEFQKNKYMMVYKNNSGWEMKEFKK